MKSLQCHSTCDHMWLHQTTLQGTARCHLNGILDGHCVGASDLGQRSWRGLGKSGEKNKVSLCHYASFDDLFSKTPKSPNAVPALHAPGCTRIRAIDVDVGSFHLKKMVRCVYYDIIIIPKFMNDANCQLFDCLWQSMLVAMSVSLARCLRELHWSVVTPSSVSQIRLPSAPAPKEHRFENQRSQPVTGRHLKTSHFRDLPRPSRDFPSKVVLKWHWQVLRWGLVLPRKAKPGKATEIVQLKAEPRKRAPKSFNKSRFLSRSNHIISYHTKDSLFILYGLVNAKDHESNHPVVSYQPSQTHLTLHLLAFGFCILVSIDRFFTLSK